MLFCKGAAAFYIFRAILAAAALHDNNPSSQNVILYINRATTSRAPPPSRTRITTCYAYRVETGPYFVPGLPHIDARLPRVAQWASLLLRASRDEARPASG